MKISLKNKSDINAFCRQKLREFNNSPEVKQVFRYFLGLRKMISYRKFNLNQCSQLVTAVSSREHLAVSGDTCGQYNLGEICYWHLVSRAGDAAEHPVVGVSDSFPQQRVIEPKVLIVLRLRNVGLHKRIKSTGNDKYMYKYKTFYRTLTV